MAQTADDLTARIPSWARWLVWAVAPLLIGLLAVHLGRTFSWDVRNYHYYNGFAGLEGRLGHDVAPAARQSFHNPLLDVPFYLAYRHLPGRVAGGLLGWLHGFNFPLVFLLAFTVMARAPGRARTALALATALAAVTHGSFLVQAGGASQDNLVSLLVLAALVALLQPGPSGPSGLRIAAAGALIGAAVGLKPPAAVYAIGAAVAVPSLPASDWIHRLRRLAPLSLGGLAGAALTGGFWALRLERLTGNPIFPYLNQIFRSEYLPAHSFEYRRFLSAESFLYLEPSSLGIELRAVRNLFRTDVRLSLLVLLLVLWWLRRLARRGSAASPLVERSAGIFLLLFFLGSFVTWLRIFAIERYLLAATLLTPLLLLFLLERILGSKRARAAALAGLIVALALTIDLSNDDRLAWNPNPFEIDRSSLVLQDDALVLMIDQSPSAYVIPGLPRGARFLRPVGNLHLRESDPLYWFIAELTREHPGPIFALYEWWWNEPEELAGVLAPLGLEQDRSRCVPLRGERIVDRLVVCPCRRVP